MTAKIETTDVLPLALDRETLRDVIDLALWAGQLLLQRTHRAVDGNGTRGG